ncbi:unnamed protein product [Adineta ricciae]|uniref:Ion transport domain-containing protein n=1 Tax=Adineta ricciae TaxID=249248 RepID=A0A814I8C0_ADIRI|nr:unnamed protein product [Adineta ricciae]
MNRINVNLFGWDGETPLHIAARLTEINRPLQTEQSSILLYLLNSTKVKINIDIQDSQGRTPLHFAVMYNCFESAKCLMKYGAKLDVPDIRGAIPLHYACRFHQDEKIIEMIQLLSRDESLLDYKTRDNKRPIDVAAEHGNLKVIQHLLKFRQLEVYNKKAAVIDLVQAAARHHQNEVLSFLKNQYQHMLNSYINTLHFACRQLHGDKMISHLINRESIMYQDQQSGFSPLMIAIQHRQLKCVKELLAHEDFTSDAFELISFTSLSNVLHICAKINQDEITSAIFNCPYMSVFLAVAADVHGDTPLHVCAQVGNTHMTRLLLHYMAQKNISPVVPISHHPTYRSMTNLDSNGRPPEKPSNQKTRQIISQTSPLNNHVWAMLTKKNNSKLIPLHEAIHHGHLDVIKEMLQFVHVSMINQYDDQRRTSLHMAAEKGHLDIVELLLNHGADAHACDINDCTPLHDAARCSMQENDNKERPQCIESLVKHGHVNVNSMNIRLESPLHIACEYGSSELFTCLLELGANLFDTNIDGYNCLELAVIKGNEEVVRFLIQHEDALELMRNAQIREEKRSWSCFSTCHKIADTPMRKLIREMPNMALLMLEKCSFKVGNKETKVFNQIYIYEFLDDQYTVKDWEEGNFGVKKNIDKQSKLYTSKTIDLVTNHPLFLMASCEATDLMAHPLSTYLVQQKYNKFGIYLYCFFILFYIIYLAIFTTVALRTDHPQAYYDLANINSFDNSLCYNVSQVLLSGSVGLGGRKETADYVLKYILYVLIWCHVFKDLCMIIEISQVYVMKTFGHWLEIAAVVLAFVFVYDQKYQTNLTFRCPLQWEIGAFALLLSWLALLQYVRFLPIVGLYVAMLTVILRKFMKFLIILVILISGFALSFHMVFQNFKPFKNTGLSYFKAAMMVSGELDFDDFMYNDDTEAYYKVAYVIYILFGVVMTIFVTNLLIGLAVGEIPPLMKQAEDHVNLIFFQLVAECEIFRYQLAWVLCRSDMNDAIAYSYQDLKRIPWYKRLKRWILTRCGTSVNDDDQSESTMNEMLEQHTLLLQDLKKKMLVLVEQSKPSTANRQLQH